MPKTLTYNLATFRRKSPFMSSVREKARMLRMSIRTEDAYVHWISDLICWTGWKTPETITNEDVTRYLSELATKRKVSASTQNQARSALEFLFMNVLQTRRKCKLARNILTRSELDAILKSLPKKYRAAFDKCARLSDAAKLYNGHTNSVRWILRARTKSMVGTALTFPGVRRSMALHELIATRDWHAIEHKYGRNMLITACAEFVRSFPQSLVDNLSS